MAKGKRLETFRGQGRGFRGEGEQRPWLSTLGIWDFGGGDFRFSYANL